ncbi:hypothetical protein [uncultured Amnibacterium sp.]|uniref:hypothetical protein n=1 Tax=uncultured Amnibacterium sp. TaxID=1631851 RepID=UPI0035CC5B91
MRRLAAVIAATLLVLSGLTACTASKGDTATTQVGSSGFEAKLDDVTVAGGAKVAAVSTRVVLTREKTALAPLLRSKYVQSVGSTVKLTLGTKLQPKTPITLTFTIDKSKVPAGTASLGVLARSEGSSKVTVLAGRYDAKAGTVTVNTPHLSIFDPVFMAVGSFLSDISTTASLTFKAVYPAPEQCDSRATLDGAVYSATPAAGLVPCLSAKNGKVQVALHSTKGVPVHVTPSPSGFTGVEQVTTQPSDAAVRAVLRAFQGTKSSEILGGETLTYSFDNAKPLTSVSATNDFITSMTLYAAAVFESVLEEAYPSKQLENATRLVGLVSCFRDAIAPAKSESDPETRGLVGQALISCAGLIPVAGAVVQLLAMIPSVIMNAFVLIADELTGNKTGVVRINQVVKPITSVKLADYLAYSEGPYYQYRFDSPSGNLQCVISQGEDSSPWGCLARSFTWSAPTNLPDTYGETCAQFESVRLPGAMIASYPGGGFYNTCANNDTTSLNAGKVLPLNSKISVRGVTCTSGRDSSGAEQMTCTGPSGSALTMSKAAMTFKQPTSGWTP